MPERIALKRLTPSDLTFFESLFRTLNVGNQKAINLNADAFIDQLYPALPGLVPALGDVIPIALTIIGPACAPPHAISRSITKRAAYKNWRLNGEFIRDPEGQPGRFDVLKAGDLAVMDFSGDPGPQGMTLLLIAAASPEDEPLHASLSNTVLTGHRTMVRVTRAQIAAAAAAVPPSHQVWGIATDTEFEAALEDAALGGIKGTDSLAAKTAKTVSAVALAAARAAAEKNGREGEALAWVHLKKMKEAGLWSSVEWASRANAVSPFDFRAFDSEGGPVLIDAKSTTGQFERVIHMSAAELATAKEAGRYDLWRVYAIDPEGARLRIAEAIGPLAGSILNTISPPQGVTLDSVSIDPSCLAWGDEIAIERPDDPPDDD